MNAARGVLVPTSWVGQASRDFAARNDNRIQTSKADSNTSSRERLGIEALVSLPRPRPAGNSTASPDQPPLRRQGPSVNPGSAPGRPGSRLGA